MKAPAEPILLNALPQDAKLRILARDAGSSRKIGGDIGAVADQLESESFKGTDAIRLAKLLRRISKRAEDEFFRVYRAHGIQL